MFTRNLFACNPVRFAYSQQVKHIVCAPPLSRFIQTTSSLDPLGRQKMSIMFTLQDGSGSLSTALKFFEDHKVNMTRIESRPCKRNKDYEFYVDFQGSPDDLQVNALLTDLRINCPQVNILHSKKVHWFPRKLKEVDILAAKVLDAGTDLESDHPGFNDQVYRNRRCEIAKLTQSYTINTPIPRIQYTDQEISAWSAVYKQIMPLMEKHACDEYLRLLPLLRSNCGYAENNIPQLEDISVFLKECTGFRLRPVAGLLSARNFLYGLAFRTFFSTQYIRHHSKPLYTPEPDICHELLGHAPLFADQNFADFSQEIGLASIGATDEQILKLARCYWFSVEFGLCLQNGKRKAYGAGLLSSYGELEYAMSDQPEVRSWDPYNAGEQDYPITEYQPVYYLADSFEDAKLKMKEYSDSFARPFNVRYNPYTQSLDVDGNIELKTD